MVENIDNENIGQTWKVLHKHFVNHMQEGPRLLPSGRLKAKVKIDYHAVIENASRSMIRFKKPERLIKMIVRVITEQVGVVHAGVLLHKDDKRSYVLIDSKGMIGEKMPVGYVRIREENPLIKAFSTRRSVFLNEKGVLSTDNFKLLLKDKELLKKNHDLKNRINQVRKEMDLLGANITWRSDPWPQDLRREVWLRRDRFLCNSGERCGYGYHECPAHRKPARQDKRNSDALP